MKTYGVDEAIEQILGSESGLKDPHRWVIRQIRIGKFQAYKIGNRYRMTQAQIDAALQTLRYSPGWNKPKPVSPVIQQALTRTSARQLKAVNT